MMVYMWEESEETISFGIPLQYKALSPNILCNPEKLVMDFCFINYEYKRIIEFRNDDANLHCSLKYTPEYVGIPYYSL